MSSSNGVGSGSCKAFCTGTEDEVLIVRRDCGTGNGAGHSSSGNGGSYGGGGSTTVTTILWSCISKLCTTHRHVSQIDLVNRLINCNIYKVFSAGDYCHLRFMKMYHWFADVQYYTFEFPIWCYQCTRSKFKITFKHIEWLVYVILLITDIFLYPHKYT